MAFHPPAEIGLEIASYFTLKERANMLALVDQYWNAIVLQSNYELRTPNDLLDKFLPKSKAILGAKEHKKRSVVGSGPPNVPKSDLQYLVETLYPGYHSRLEARAKWYRMVHFDERTVRRLSHVAAFIEGYKAIRKAPLLPAVTHATVKVKSDLGLKLLLALPAQVHLHLLFGPAVTVAAIGAAVTEFTDVMLSYWDLEDEDEDEDLYRI
ncbi:hypothetical protein QCA50_001318 [Cerrena zonata]|uniref:Uncharacterized protein n=1 Tax=Cerrena zonata TaxID=2478898 RepID=A0AAW0GTR5_9APHY